MARRHAETGRGKGADLVKFEIGEVCYCVCTGEDGKHQRGAVIECTIRGFSEGLQFYGLALPDGEFGLAEEWQLRKKKPPEQPDNEAWGNWNDMLDGLKQGIPA